MAYVYYQRNEKEKWSVTSDEKAALEKIKKDGAKRYSILSVSSVINEETDQNSVLYKGPFYIDIDTPDVADAIESAKQLAAKFKAIGVPETAMEVYCSGKKGFHFYVHQKLFSNGRATKFLPLIYKRMATDFYVPGMDFQVYCAGKGNLFRIPNVQREDGRYKVQVSLSELEHLDPQRYVELCSSPRSVSFTPMQAPDVNNSHLLQSFEAAKEWWKQEQKNKREAPGIPDSSLAQFQKDGPPQCVRDLSEYKIKSSVHFNQAAFQMAIYLQRSSSQAHIVDSLMSRMADTGTSTTYAAQRDRINHIKGLYHYVKEDKKKQFSCPAMRSLLATRPCENCPLHDPNKLQAEIYEIEERPDGYYAVNSKTETRLTSFLLVPSRMVYSYDSEMNGRKRVYTSFNVEVNHETISQVKIEESGWTSRTSFVKAFQGISNLKVTATDNDIQNLKHYVLRDIEDIEHQEVVNSVGIHRDMMYKKPRYTYVEHGMSANKWGLKNTHILEGFAAEKGSALPQLRRFSLPDPASDRSEFIFRNLAKMNEPEVMAPILGWLGACHLKSHIMGIRGEFPLLGLWGGRGSGKTRTAIVTTLLCGSDYTLHAPPTLSNITEFALLSTCTSTTTVPRVFDEFNRRAMSSRQYAKWSEHLKQAFNNSASQRGRLRGKGESSSGGIGAIVDSFYMTAPLMVLSEHAPEVPALNDRMYKVMLVEPSITPDRRAHMQYIMDNKEDLIRLSKCLVLKALETRDEWVKDKLNEWLKLIPGEYTERQQLTRAVIGLGLEYLDHILCDVMSLPLGQDILALKDTFLTTLTNLFGVQSNIGHTTEVDYMMKKLTELAFLSSQNSTPYPLNSSQIQAEGDFLLIDLPIIFTLLRMYLVQSRDKLPIPDVDQFRLLLKGEPYFVDDSTIRTDMNHARPMVRLSLPLMAERGIDTTMF